MSKGIRSALHNVEPQTQSFRRAGLELLKWDEELVEGVRGYTAASIPDFNTAKLSATAAANEDTSVF